MDLEEVLVLDERSAIDFVAKLRKGWAEIVYPALYGDLQRIKPDPVSLEDAEEIYHSSVLYAWFSQIERSQQKMMWRTIGDVVLRHRVDLQRILDVKDPQFSSIEMDIDLDLPSWYLDTDIHLQPGSFYLDELSAYIYELGARVVMLRDNDGYKFHRLFAATALPDLPEAERIVDVGCGFGKSTQVLPGKYPNAQVIGIDLSAPNLKLAHARAESSEQRIHWKLGPSYDTGIESNSVDLVTGTMVLHEMPKAQIEATLAEAARILRPGGHIRFLEFWPTDDLYFNATVYEHAERNNEPFFRDLFATDAPAVLSAHDVADSKWVPFDERETGLTATRPADRSEWHFPWAVLSGQKSSLENRIGMTK